MTVKIYQSTDADAPILTGQAGTLVTVLDKCLVDGYSARSITSITRSGQVATATTSTVHGLVIGSQIPVTLLLAGANEAEYNGEFVVTPTATNQFTYTVSGSPATPATGTITTKRASLGWSKPFAGTSKAAYRMPAGTNRLYLQVQDDNTGATQRSAQCRGYEAMTDVDTGTGPFPTVAQISGKGLWAYKSQTQDSTARPWTVIGDEYGVYLLIAPYTGNAVAHTVSFFGDIDSYKPGDVYGSAIIAGVTEQTTTLSNSDTSNTPLPTLTSTLGATIVGHYIARSFSHLGGAQAFGKMSDAVNSTSIGLTGMVYPSPVDNGYHVSRVRLTQASALRGLLSGVLQPLHVTSLTTGDVVSGVQGLPNRVLLIFALAAIGASDARAAFDITGPWR